MVFTSLNFSIFLFVTANLYYFCGKVLKGIKYSHQIFIIVASLVFYSFSSIWFLPILGYVVLLTYFAPFFAKNRLRLFVVILFSVVPLLFYKYANIIGLVKNKTLIMPLGISFFTFQSLSYIIDCYKKKFSPEKNPLEIVSFVTFFPVISSGPIQRFSSLSPQLKKWNEFDYQRVSDGLKSIAFGIFKKLCIADFLSIQVDYIYSNLQSQYSFAVILAVFFYSIQIYCDFSGYSDMAIGAANILGFNLSRNFDHPYFADGIGDFWHRWHISLSTWLKDYIYIPLGGSRVSNVRIYLNLMITFLVSGIWHGATNNFLLWGGVHGLCQCIERKIKISGIKFPKAINVFVCFVVVSLLWVFFRLESISDAMLAFKKMGMVFHDLASVPSAVKEAGVSDTIKMFFGLANNPDFGYLKGLLKAFVLIFVLAGIEILTYNKSGIEIVRSKNIVVRWILYIILVFSIFNLYVSGLSANFIYNHF